MAQIIKYLVGVAKEMPEEKERVTKLIREIVGKHTRVLGKWPEAGIKFIKDCIEIENGIPQFVPSYAKERWGPGLVLLRCWSYPAKTIVKGGFVTDVPEEDIKIIEERTGEWKYFLEKYKSAG